MRTDSSEPSLLDIATCLLINIVCARSNAVGSVSDYRCVPACRSMGREFDPDPVQYFLEINHEIFPTVILCPATDLFKKGCCQLQAI